MKNKYFKALEDVIERNVHIEDKLNELLERSKHIEEKNDENLRRSDLLREKIDDISERSVHIEDRIQETREEIQFYGRRDNRKCNIEYINRLKSRKKVLNIVFSTTRQWNPGDEIILRGVMNIFNKLGISYNPIIFNRHPDVRSQFPQMFKTSHVPHDFNLDEKTVLLESNLKFGMFDNSVKPNMDLSFADWVIFAGTPEWCNGRTNDLYHLILKYNLQTMILGVGGGFDCYDNKFQEVIYNAKAFTVREQTTLNITRENGFSPTYLPCPALLSAPEEKEKRIYKVTQIALIYQATKDETVIWNGCSQETYDYIINLYRKIINTYGESIKFSIVCHYIDELPLAIRDFPELDILYSYDSAQYIDIYSQFDLVIGPRVHGIGTAASLLIPGLAILHDARGETCEGFLAKLIYVGMEHNECLDMINDSIMNIEKYSNKLARHKRKTMEAYIELVSKALQEDKVIYKEDGTIDYMPFDMKELVNNSEILSSIQYFDNLIKK